MENAETMTVIVDDRAIETERRPLAGDDVLALAGLPDGLVIRIDGGRAVHLAAHDSVELGLEARAAFRTFHPGTLRHLRVDGVLWDWGSAGITEEEVRAIAAAAEDSTVHLEGADEPVRRGGLIDLTTAWPPQVEIRSPVDDQESEARVPVTINGRSVTLARPEATFEDLVGLAFPGTDLASPGTRALTVTYRHGPPSRPEGSLVSRERIQVQHGEVFSVTATNKS